MQSILNSLSTGFNMVLAPHHVHGNVSAPWDSHLIFPIFIMVCFILPGLLSTYLKLRVKCHRFRDSFSSFPACTFYNTALYKACLYQTFFHCIAMGILCFSPGQLINEPPGKMERGSVLFIFVVIRLVQRMVHRY